MVNAAIFILTRNDPVRKVYLKTSLYFLFKNFNEAFKYPVIIFHEGDFDNKAQEEIFKSVRVGCRSLVSFCKLDDEDFKVPSHIDEDKARACVNLNATPYWRNIAYRNMCRWWIVHMPKYAKSYDYVMRIDDDLFIEEPIETDIIEYASKNNHAYVSNIIHVDCPICCFGFRDLLVKEFPDKKEFIDSIFQHQQVPIQAYQLAGLRSLLSLTHPNSVLGDKIDLWSPVMNYNNFHITKTSFWLREDVQKLIKTIDESGYIYYFRLGDSPIQSAITMLLAQPNELGRVKFRYSKRLQREAHEAHDGVLYSYMPHTYDKTSDVTEQ